MSRYTAYGGRYTKGTIAHGIINDIMISGHHRDTSTTGFNVKDTI